MQGMRQRTVVIVAYPGVQSLDVIGPNEVFAAATRVMKDTGRAGGYRLTLASSGGGQVESGSGVSLGTVSLSEVPDRIDTLVVPGGDQARGGLCDPRLMAWIESEGRHCQRLATVCTGAFLAAAAGLLDGRRATTHWASADRLAAEFPSVEVDADPIYIRDGRVWTSAGVTAGIDLALALVEDDLGAGVAQTVARHLVMFLHRPGGQSQFASPVWVPRAERSAVRVVQSRVETTPGGDHRLGAMASAASMSVRNFARVFTAEVGEPPGRYVERVRVEAARRELETTDDTLDVIAGRCGLGSAESLRRAFRRRLGVTPDAYRRRFRIKAREGRSA